MAEITNAETRATPAQQREAVLDGLRGLAILIVLASHFSNFQLFGPGLFLAGTGKSGVYLFFVLSAFLLTRLLLIRTGPQLRSADTWIDYALRRVLRIWPLYLVVLVSSLLLAPGLQWWHYRIDLPAFLRHLTLQEGQSVLWSIPVEFKAYLVLPVIVVVLAVLRGRPAWMSALLFALCIAAVAWIWPASAMAQNDVRLGPYLPLFLAGAGAAWLDGWLRARELAGTRGGLPRWLAGTWVLLMLLLWLLTTPLLLGWLQGAEVPATRNHGWMVFFALLWASLLLALLRAPSWVQWLFNNRPMRWIGLTSFSVYLWHMVVLDAWRQAVPAGAVSGLGLFLAIMVVGGVSYFLVERPLQGVRWRRRVPAVQAPAER